MAHLHSDEEHQALLDKYTEIAYLAGGLAHEIKNPLSTIRLNMELLAEDLGEGESQREKRAMMKIRTVQRECQRLQDLLDDFLNYAKLRTLHLEPTNLNDVVGQTLDFYQPQAEENGIEVVRYLDADLPSVLLDRETFHSALLNLVINAQQAMPDGGRLEVRTRTTHRGVALDLIDTGTGMDERIRGQIFKAFYSTKPAGSGLGLPTARNIIEAHGGTIDVQSEVGHGTQFTLEFPTPRRIGGKDAKSLEIDLAKPRPEALQ